MNDILEFLDDFECVDFFDGLFLEVYNDQQN